MSDFDDILNNPFCNKVISLAAELKERNCCLCEHSFCHNCFVMNSYKELRNAAIDYWFYLKEKSNDNY